MSMPRVTADTAHASHLHKRLTKKLFNKPKKWPTFNKIKYVTNYTLLSHHFLQCIKEISYTKTHSRINREGSRLTILNWRQERGPQKANRK